MIITKKGISLCKRIYRFSSVESTMKIASSLAKEGAPEGTVIIAEEQTKGKGRAGHYWFSPKGGLYLSVILRPLFSPSYLSKLSLMGAIGIVKSIREIAPSLPSKIRWPNDAVIEKRKIGGVLLEARRENNKVCFVIMGIGVNLNIEEFPFPLSLTATSLKKELGHSISLKDFLLTLFEKLEDLYSSFQKDFPSFLEEIYLFSSLMGEQVKLRNENEELNGQVQGIDEEGNLILRLESGLQKRISPEKGFIVNEFSNRRW